MNAYFVMSYRNESQDENWKYLAMETINYDPNGNNSSEYISVHDTYAEAEAVVDNMVSNNADYIKLSSADIEGKAA
ncbi:MAG: hypothetical protein ACD_20C00433G0003 [uncultured bacterium]|nr:MAG: hypothetical protein ACD_20C00433G0003 [uncultured bacterium]